MCTNNKTVSTKRKNDVKGFCERNGITTEEYRDLLIRTLMGDNKDKSKNDIPIKQHSSIILRDVNGAEVESCLSLTFIEDEKVTPNQLLDVYVLITNKINLNDNISTRWAIDLRSYKEKMNNHEDIIINEIENIYVLPELRNKGLASIALNQYCEGREDSLIILKAGASLMEYDSEELDEIKAMEIADKLLKFYEKRGFVNVNDKLGQYEFGYTMVYNNSKGKELLNIINGNIDKTMGIVDPKFKVVGKSELGRFNEGDLVRVLDIDRNGLASVTDGIICDSINTENLELNSW